MVARTATVSRTGRPHVNPLYFVYGNGEIYLGTSERTLAAMNARANPRVTVLFNVESAPNDRRVLRISGRATVRTDSGLRRWYLRRDVWKYFVNWRGFSNAIMHARLLFLVRHYLSSGSSDRMCVLEVLPETAELLTAPERVRNPEAL
ncbi:hypothetical protein NS14008_28120 [Nocardia seriolae]|nr:hypothetical protein NS14008_28120 [Nocardia seriolae]